MCFPALVDSRSSIKTTLLAPSLMYSWVVMSGVPEAMLYSTHAEISYMASSARRMLSRTPVESTNDMLSVALPKATDEDAGVTNPVAVDAYSSAKLIIVAAVPMDAVACGLAMKILGMLVFP